jgi:hypothetical protein
MCEFFCIKYSKLAVTYSPSKEVPSVLAGLTSVFGKGTGVPPPLDHQLTVFNIQIFWLYSIQ